MGVINIIKGEYAEAIQNFGSENSFCKALAQTLNKQDADGEATLTAMGEKESGWFYYLLAITAAKQSKDEAVFENLRTAISKTADIKLYAKDDVEFIKYVDNETFKTIVQ
jgi:hypothetical protein